MLGLPFEVSKIIEPIKSLLYGNHNNHSITNCFFANYKGYAHTVPVVKRSVAESVLARASVHTRNAAFEAVSALEQNFSAPLLKVERSVTDRFLKRSESSLNTLSEQKLQQNLVLVNDILKSKGSVAKCMTDRACVHAGNASEQFLLRNRTLILVHTVLEQFLKWSKILSGTV